MPHTDAISFAVTLGLLLIILRIISVVSVRVSVVVVVVSVVVSVEIAVVSVGTFVLFPNLRYVSILSGLLLSPSSSN